MGHGDESGGAAGPAGAAGVVTGADTRPGAVTRVQVVTDSTAYLDAVSAQAHDIVVVPLQVVVDGVPKVEGREIGPGEVADALRRHVPVTTSRPSPQAFLDVYRAAAADGATHVVSVHLSGGLSGTADAARLAAKDSPVPVEVVDSGSLGMGLGFAVLTAAQIAAAGAAPERVAGAAAERAASSSAIFYVDTLEYLRRGGRIGPASAMLGTALAIKPLLYLDDGVIKPLEKVRTGTRAVARLEDLAVARAGEVGSLDSPGDVSVADGPGDAGDPAEPVVDVAVHHLDNVARAEALAERLSARLPGLGDLVVAEVGAVIGAHVGPGMLAVVVSPRLFT